MELRDYVAALRRYWLTWVAVALLSTSIAALAVTFLPPTYSATAQVFVSSSAEGSGGFQFVASRVKSYPDVATSPAVLDPIIAELDLDTTYAQLRQKLTASNPAETSQVEITAVDDDPARAAEIANAAARRFTTVIEELESPATGDSPVRLTVTAPATVPTAPSDPDSVLLLALGAVVGVTAGAALALLRSHLDTTLHTEDDVRHAWGDGGNRLSVHTSPGRRARRSRLIGRPATVLARRLELMAEQRPLKVLLVAPGSDARSVARFADEVAAELRTRDIPSAVTGSESGQDRPTGPGRERRVRVRLALGSPHVPLREWRQQAEQFDGVVLVVEQGAVHAGELQELRQMLRSVGTEPLAVALVPRRARRGGDAPRRTTADLSPDEGNARRISDDRAPQPTA